MNIAPNTTCIAATILRGRTFTYKPEENNTKLLQLNGTVVIN
jgi:hypothetical protein